LLRQLNYYLVIVSTLPCLILALSIGLIEVFIDDGAGRAAAFLARPFLWAVDRRPGELRRTV
jgi:hypothetical protein